MKTFARALLPLLVLPLAACSTLSGGSSKTGQDLAANGPTVVDARTNPGTFELNKQLQATSPTEVLAEVKDFMSKITEVKLRFVNALLEVPMTNIGGSTWRAVLTPEQLKQLAVGGQTMNYQAQVIATNEDGITNVSQQALNVSVKAPDLATDVG